MKSIYKIYKRYREDIWSNLVRSSSLNAFLVIKLVLFNKGLYKKKKEDFSRNALFRKKNYTTNGLVFLNKQKLRYFYFNASYGQLKKIFLIAQKQKYDLVDSFLGLLESRLDVILYRLNFAHTMFEARTLLSYKKVFVNSEIVTKSNYLVSPGDVVSINDYTFKIKLKNLLKSNTFVFICPKYLEIDYKLCSAIFLYRPKLQEIYFPFYVDAQLALQFFKDIT